MRETRAGFISHMAGCSVCHRTAAAWFARNAQGLAAQHHDRTGHPTWFEGVMSVRYGHQFQAPTYDQTGDENAKS